MKFFPVKISVRVPAGPALAISLVLSLHMFPSMTANAQCVQSAQLNGTSFTNDNSSGEFAFSNPMAAQSSDNSRATATALGSLLVGNTQMLKGSGFGFNIPDGSVICGIQLEVERSATGLNALTSVVDNDILLLKNGAVAGDDRAKIIPWTTTDGILTYGGMTDLWGTTWTAAEINSPTFGTALSASLVGVVALIPSARIDHVKMSVAYSQVTLPVHITRFTSSLIAETKVKLAWEIGEMYNTITSVQRSYDAVNWTSIQSFQGDGISDRVNYTYVDEPREAEFVYYRIELNNSGNLIYSNTLMVERQVKNGMGIYPNPAVSAVTVRSDIRITSVSCYNLAGARQNLIVKRQSDFEYMLEIGKLPAGVYYMRVNDRTLKFIKK